MVKRKNAVVAITCKVMAVAAGAMTVLEFEATVRADDNEDNQNDCQKAAAS